jgi:hypothetical protein
MGLPSHALRRAGVLPPGAWLALRTLGITPLILLGYTLAGVTPVVLAALLPADTVLDLWDNLWWLVPTALLALGGQAHWFVYVNWRYHEAGKTSRERLKGL